MTDKQLLTDTSLPTLAAEKWVLAGCEREAEGLKSSGVSPCKFLFVMSLSVGKSKVIGHLPGVVKSLSGSRTSHQPAFAGSEL